MEFHRIPFLIKKQKPPGGGWTSDATLTMSNGVKLDAPQIQEYSKAGRFDFKALEYHEMDVRVYGGDVAIVTGRLTEQITVDGEDLSGTKRFTRTWVKEADGVWRLAAHHSTPIAKPSR